MLGEIYRWNGCDIWKWMVMNNETYFVIEHFKRNQELLENIKKLLFGDIIWYLKSNLDLKNDTELTQVQCNLFYAAIGNVDWNEVIIELEI